MRSRNKYSGGVIEWDRDGITVEADQRHEIMKGLELERAHALWKGEMKARGRTDADEDRPSGDGMT